MFLDYFALFMLFFVFVTIVYAVIYIHDIPYGIAQKRNHPHQDAIHIAGWVSMFTLHAIWPFLWIWATLYHPDTGYGLDTKNARSDAVNVRELIASLDERLTKLETISGEKK